MAEVRSLRTADTPHAKNVEELLELLLKKARAGRLPSLILIGEEIGNTQPLLGIVGRYRADPARAIGHVAVMERKLVTWAADLAPDIEE